MKISVIIPTFNEEENIEKIVCYIKKYGGESIADLIVVDGGSGDRTIEVAENAGAMVVLSPGKGRSAQMNWGASLANGDILYFIHADTFPPASFVADILQACRNRNDLGRYRTKFNSNKFILKLNAWFTRFDLFVCMGGDQTLFIKRSLFEECRGFREEMKIMEEYELCERAREKGRYKILKGYALISARKYETNSWLRVQLANAKVTRMYQNGASQADMISTYQQMLNYRKSAF
jgi:rSAM/selenodomain-associated transferase 2